MTDENLPRFRFLFFMFFKFTPLDFWSACYSPPSPNSGSSLQSQLSPIGAGILISNCLTHPRQHPLLPSPLITWRLQPFDTSAGLSLKHPLPFRTQREKLQSRFYFPCNLLILPKDFQGNAKQKSVCDLRSRLEGVYLCYQKQIPLISVLMSFSPLNVISQTRALTLAFLPFQLTYPWPTTSLWSSMYSV